MFPWTNFTWCLCRGASHAVISYRHVQYFDDITTHKPRRIAMVRGPMCLCDRAERR